jgi:Zn-finger nucleic acid-binding protein
MPLLICPNCNVGMAQVQRSGIELDVCPQCRGVWLDRGELEKLLQPLREAEAIRPPSLPHSQSSFPPSTAGAPWGQQPPQPYPLAHHDGHHRDHGHHDGHGFGTHGEQQKKGWRSLLDVFD